MSAKVGIAERIAQSAATVAVKNFVASEFGTSIFHTGPVVGKRVGRKGPAADIFRQEFCVTAMDSEQGRIVKGKSLQESFG